MHSLALAESGGGWLGAGSRPAGLRRGRAIPGLRRDAALPVRQNTRQGREGGALPEPYFLETEPLLNIASRRGKIAPNNELIFDADIESPAARTERLDLCVCPVICCQMR